MNETELMKNMVLEFYIFLIVVGGWWCSCNAGGGVCIVKRFSTSTKLYNSPLVMNSNSHYLLSLSHYDAVVVSRVSSSRENLKYQIYLSYQCRMDTGISTRMDVWKSSILWYTTHLKWSQSSRKIFHFYGFGHGKIRLYIKYKLLKRRYKELSPKWVLHQMILRNFCRRSHRKLGLWWNTNLLTYEDDLRDLAISNGIGIRVCFSELLLLCRIWFNTYLLSFEVDTIDTFEEVTVDSEEIDTCPIGPNYCMGILCSACNGISMMLFDDSSRWYGRKSSYCHPVACACKASITLYDIMYYSRVWFYKYLLSLEVCMEESFEEINFEHVEFEMMFQFRVWFNTYFLSLEVDSQDSLDVSSNEVEEASCPIGENYCMGICCSACDGKSIVAFDDPSRWYGRENSYCQLVAEQESKPSIIWCGNNNIDFGDDRHATFLYTMHTSVCFFSS